MIHLTLSILPAPLSVCRLPAAAPIPSWALSGEFYAITRTSDELSLVCPAASVPGDIQAESGWRGLKVEGPLDFALVGILAELSGVLAQAGISLFAISTYETDYLLVKADRLNEAARVLTAAGCSIKAGEDLPGNKNGVA